MLTALLCGCLPQSRPLKMADTNEAGITQDSAFSPAQQQNQNAGTANTVTSPSSSSANFDVPTYLMQAVTPATYPQPVSQPITPQSASSLPPLTQTLSGLWSSEACSHAITAPEALTFDVDKEGSLALSPIPGAHPYFVGRVKVVTPTYNTPEQFTLGLFRLDSDANDTRKFHFTFVRSLLDTTVPNGIAMVGSSLRVQTAYDPSIATFQNRTWIAFECGGGNFPGTAASCIVEFNVETFQLNLSTLRPLVMGVNTVPTDPTVTSASVPRLFTHKDRFYLYWIAVLVKKVINPGEGPFAGLRARGIELRFDGTSWSTTFASLPINADHPNASDVWTPTDTPTTNSMAGIFQVLSDDSFVYALGNVGGSGCYLPTDPINGCARLSISRSVTPLGNGIFNQERILDGILPPLYHEFSQIIRLPNQEPVLFGAFGRHPQRTDNGDFPGHLVGYSLRNFNTFANRPWNKATWLFATFRNFVNQAPVLADLQSWLGIAQVEAPDGLNLLLQNSVVHQRLATHLYQTYLHRAPSSSELADMSGTLTASGYLAGARRLVTSSEFQQNLTVNPNDRLFEDPNWQRSNYVDLAYRLLLKRAPDAGGLNSFTSLMQSNGGSEDWKSVFRGISRSPEFWQSFVQTSAVCQ